MRVALATTLVLLLVLATGATAQAEPRLLISLRLPNSGQPKDFQADLLYNCNLFFSNGGAVQGTGRWAYATVSGRAVGALDAAAGRGDTFTRRTEWRVEALPPSDARPTVFKDLGVAIRGRTVFLTGRITRGKTLLAAARRTRLAVVRRAKIEQTPLVDGEGDPVPNTFTYLASGRLKMRRAMSRALERTRCKDRARNPYSHRLKPGYVLGRLTVGYRPDSASGLAGDARVVASATTYDTGDEVGVEPAELIAPMVSGLPAPLACLAGVECGVIGGSIGLGGSFDLVYQGRRTRVAGLVVTTTSTPPDSPHHTITGTLDGAPVIVADGIGLEAGLSFEDDFAQRAGAALGAAIEGGVSVELRFTDTGA